MIKNAPRGSFNKSNASNVPEYQLSTINRDIDIEQHSLLNLKGDLGSDNEEVELKK